MLTTGTILAGRYEIIDKIGTGGMADVYKAKDTKLNRFVAVKVMKREFSEDKIFVAKFRSEAQAAAGFTHPNIVSVYDVGEEEGLYYIVMELVDGITLKRYIERKGKLTIRETTSIAVQVSMGIEAAHNNHIIHRDIKPQNIIISREGKAKVTDFGIAKAASQETKTDNTVMGSVHYTSPEQAKGEGSNEKSDIYSLGITIYEMLTGQVPFDGDTAVAVALHHIQDPLPSPRELVPEIPESLEAIVMKCTEKKPSDRYENMAELINDLKLSLSVPYVPETEEETEEEPEEQEELPVTEQETDEPEEPVEEEAEQEGEVTPQIDKVMSVLGVIAAIVIIGLAVFLAYTVVTTMKQAGTHSSADATEEPEYDKETQRIMIDLTGMTYEEAADALNKMSLGIRKGGEDYSSELEDGLIMGQSVDAGEIVDIHTTIQVTISSGSASFRVADVSNMTVEQATKTLEEQGLTVKEGEYVFDNDIAVGCVVSTTPVVGTQVRTGDEVTLTISRGKSRGEVEVPNVVGFSKEKAIDRLENAGLSIGEITTSSYYDSSVPDDGVVSQSIDGGKTVEEGTQVDLVLNKGADTSHETETPEETPKPSAEGGAGSVTITLDDLPSDFNSAYITLKLVEEIDGEEKVKVIYEGRLNKEDFPFKTNVSGSEGSHSGTVIMFLDSDQADKEWTVTF